MTETVFEYLILFKCSVDFLRFYLSFSLCSQFPLRIYQTRQCLPTFSNNSTSVNNHSLRVGICRKCVQTRFFVTCHQFSPTLVSTNCVPLLKKLGTEGRVKLLPLLVEITEPASNPGSSRDTSKVTAWAESSVGSSPTRVWDKIVLPTSSSEFRILIALALDYK